MLPALFACSRSSGEPGPSTRPRSPCLLAQVAPWIAALNCVVRRSRGGLLQRRGCHSPSCALSAHGSLNAAVSKCLEDGPEPAAALGRVGCAHLPPCPNRVALRAQTCEAMLAKVRLTDVEPTGDPRRRNVLIRVRHDLKRRSRCNCWAAFAAKGLVRQSCDPRKPLCTPSLLHGLAPDSTDQPRGAGLICYPVLCRAPP